ncbi:MAG: radical SAM protein [Candidatus Woesearchaeota archaeon]|nr:MAG: radical SAM protein [Candidatus Woesearchaeota archaeon]
MNCPEEIIKIKAELLCWSIKPTEVAYKAFRIQNPFDHRKTGNVGLHIDLGYNSYVMAILGHKYTRSSPYELKQEGKKWFLYKNDNKACEIEIVKPPKWYSKKTSNGIPMYKLFLLEGINTLHSPYYMPCGYSAIGRQCKFCSISSSKIVERNPQDVAETAAAAFRENPSSSVSLSGGTTLTPDKSAGHLSKYVKAIRKLSKIPIFSELSPPDTNEYIDLLVKSGSNSFGFDIELWDESLRKKICPGKSEISRQRYFDTWEYALSKVGKSNVCTVLIAGLEPLESTLKGAKEITKRGVIPSILTFRPFDGSEYEDKLPPNPKELLIIGKKVSQLLRKYGLNRRNSPGCIGCAGCTIDDDFSGIMLN